MSKLGRYHSIETMGMVDGPGIRTVIFLQGCPLKCAYCHNPDTQPMKGGTPISAEEILTLAKRYKPYYNATGGGITFSGGEPLVQGEFLLEALMALKDEGYHTCLDTSGFGDERYFESILNYTDHILLDIKAFEPDSHVALTGVHQKGQFNFLKSLDKYLGKIIIRHVMLPGYTNDSTELLKMLTILKPFADKVEKIEILPYHRSGIEKYSQLKLPYLIDTVEEMPKDAAKAFEIEINSALGKMKREEYARGK